MVRNSPLVLSHLDGPLGCAAGIVDRNALILGILYLTFQAFPIIFEGRHGFNMQSTGLTFLGMAIGMLLGLCTQPYWNRCGHLSGDPN